MLIEFSATNYRSIRDTQTLSMAASKYYTDLADGNCMDTAVAGLPRLLRSAVIYGPNAAGKSNLLKALAFMQSFVLHSHAHQEGSLINVAPFALAEATRNQPATFECFFIQDSIRYQFGFAVNRERVTHEWLFAFPEGKAQRWYERSFDEVSGKEEWYFGSKFGGRRQVWRDATRKNALFLSAAIQLNNEQLKPIFNWFQNRLAILQGADINISFTINQCESEAGRQRVMEFMNAADIGIAGIDLKKIAISHESLPPELPLPIREQIMRDGAHQVLLQHKTESGELCAFDLSDESNGTRQLFLYAGPLLDVLEKGRVFFVDELDTSLHPLMVRFLIGLIHNPAINRHNAQLIFTTHDTSVLDTDIFRRDQVWFVEKDTHQASRLYPLSDFSPRKHEALEKGYLQGRYGALPYIGGDEVLMGTDNLFHKRKAKAAEAHSRKKASRKPYERILIVCEGEKTEPLYFTALRRALGLHPANVVIADKKRGLDPASLVAYALEELKKDPNFNHLYCVFDRDKHTTYEAALDRIRALRPKGGLQIHAITSIPCFEVWLLLHFEYTTRPFQAPAGESNCALVLAELRKSGRLPGYEKGGRDIFAGIAERLATAVHNAKKLDEYHAGINSDNPSTKVYVLVEKLQSLTP